MSETTKLSNSEKNTNPEEEDLDSDLLALQKKFAEIDEEADKLLELESTSKVSLNTSLASGTLLNIQQSGSSSISLNGNNMQNIGLTNHNGPFGNVSKEEVDSRSIYVGNVDYSTAPSELHKLFNACGSVARVTIPVDQVSGSSKGFAYVEFTSSEAISNAMELNETIFKGRTLKICPKRTNIPKLSINSRHRGGGRGGFYPRGAAVAAAAVAAQMIMGFSPYSRGRVGRLRPRSRSLRTSNNSGFLGNGTIPNGTSLQNNNNNRGNP